ELVGWEHSMKNELIVAVYKDLPRRRPAERLAEIISTLGIEEIGWRFSSANEEHPLPNLPVYRPSGVD
ncbi:MAG: hypothetical protein P4L42_13060, partial [Desulfocapsaceae bacterium]|nr:hypothetical protein [Desulfocapsaceae bacterium]